MAFFFSSRAGSGGDPPMTKISKGDSGSNVAAVIKSKWYGRTKNVPPPISTVISSPARPAPGSSVAASPLAQDLARATLLSPTFANNRDRDLPSTPKSAISIRKGAPKTPSSSRPPAGKSDSTSLSLAARLEELELSNAEGLLDDEGYRILRQQLFASFTAGSTAPLPSEQPPVRLSIAGPSASKELKHATSRPLADSNFHVSSSKAESIRSSQSRSTVSAVKNVLRRNTKNRMSLSNETDSPVRDNVSILSGVSRGSNSIHRILSSSKSSGSLGSDYSPSHSHSQHDLHSLSSKRTGLTGGSRTSRSNHGPPSSYNLRRAAESPADDEDDAHRQSSSDIRTEITLVQAEYKRILDNYHGAEMAALAKLPSQHHPSPSPSARPLSAVSQTTVKDRSWTILPSTNDPLASKEFGGAANGNGSTSSQTVKPSRFGSLRKKASASSSHLLSNSIFASSPARPQPSPHPTQSHSSTPTITRKSSSIKFSSSSVTSTNPPTPNPHLLPGAQIRTRASNVSSKDRPGSLFLVEDVVEVDDGTQQREIQRARKQIDKIRGSRDDAVRSYESRLEYLKTKLKTAEIHERLLKKK